MSDGSAVRYGPPASWAHIGGGALFLGLAGDFAHRIGEPIHLINRTGQEFLKRAADQGYNLVAVDADGGTEVKMIRSIKDVTFLEDGPGQALDWLSSAQLWSLSITSDAYPKNRAGNLDVDRATAAGNEVVECLASDQPKTVVGLLSKALAERFQQQGRAPVTILPLENGDECNGDMLRRLLVQYIEIKYPRSPELKAWVQNAVTFCNAMVDRIVPKPGEKHIQDFARDAAGVDPSLVSVVTEKLPEVSLVFDNADWNPILRAMTAVGAQSVKDCALMKRIKATIVNGAHNLVGVKGMSMGEDLVHLAVRRPGVETDLMGFLEEMQGTLRGIDLPDVFDLGRYCQGVIERLKLPFPGDQTSRVCRRPSAKVVPLIAAPLMELLAKGLPHHHLTVALAETVRHLVLADGPLAGKVVPDDKGRETGLYGQPVETYANAEECLQLFEDAVPGFPTGLRQDRRFGNEFQQVLDDGDRFPEFAAAVRGLGRESAGLQLASPSLA